MSSKTTLTRRQALLISGGSAAGLALASLPVWARNAPSSQPSLPIPKLIEARDGEPVTLTLEKTRHRFGPGPAVPSTGISSSYLGPVVRVRSGDTIPFRVENHLDDMTTLHWHGMLIPSDVDGGPHNTIEPGGVWKPELSISQPAATTWFHPHPHGDTARQVYGGLAGLTIVSDGGDSDRGLPTTYGVDDLPLVLQDKRFGRGGEFVYEPTMMDIMHGFQGDTLIVNGAINPVAAFPLAWCACVC
jgi:FtsP/CotA-like multicopper oxidase with cupredoxin domain